MTVSSFSENCWGEKHNGFQVLYHNFKNEQQAAKELSDFVKESAIIHEESQKHCLKLGNKVSSYGSNGGSFSPVWKIIHAWLDKFAHIHNLMVTQLQELHKVLHKYESELHKQQKSVKEREAPTLESSSAIQNAANLLEKSRDSHATRSVELEKLKRDSSSTQKEIAKVEAKVKKSYDEYNMCLEKYETVRSDYVSKMDTSANNFQNLEMDHLSRMRDHVGCYIGHLDDSLAQMGSAVKEFKNQYAVLSNETLLQDWIALHRTGTRRPDVIVFQEPDLDALLAAGAGTLTTKSGSTVGGGAGSTTPGSIVSGSGVLDGNSNVGSGTVSPKSGATTPSTPSKVLQNAGGTVSRSSITSGGFIANKLTKSKNKKNPDTTPPVKPVIAAPPISSDNRSAVDDLISMGSYNPDEALMYPGGLGDGPPPLAQPESSLEEGLNRSTLSDVSSKLSNGDQLSDLPSVQLPASSSYSVGHYGGLSSSSQIPLDHLGHGSLGQSASTKLSNFLNRRGRSSKSSQGSAHSGSSESSGTVKNLTPLSVANNIAGGLGEFSELENASSPPTNRSTSTTISSNAYPNTNIGGSTTSATLHSGNSRSSTTAFLDPLESFMETTSETSVGLADGFSTGTSPNNDVTGRHQDSLSGVIDNEKFSKQRRPLTMGLLKKSKKPKEQKQEDSPIGGVGSSVDTPVDEKGTLVVGGADGYPSLTNNNSDVISTPGNMSGDFLGGPATPLNGDVRSIASMPISPMYSNFGDDSFSMDASSAVVRGVGISSPSSNHRPSGGDTDSDSDWSDDDEPEGLRKIRIRIKDKSEVQKNSVSTDELRAASGNLSRLNLASSGPSLEASSTNLSVRDPWTGAPVGGSLKVFPKSISFTPSMTTNSQIGVPLVRNQFNEGEAGNALADADPLRIGSRNLAGRRSESVSSAGSLKSGSTRARPRPITPVAGLFPVPQASTTLPPTLPPRNVISPPAVQLNYSNQSQPHSSASFSSPLSVINRSDSLGSLSGEGFSSPFGQSAMSAGPYSASSRGPSPLTLSPFDSIPIAIAVTETVHSRCSGDDVARWLVKIDGLVTIAFPGAIVHYLAGLPDAMEFGQSPTAEFDSPSIANLKPLKFSLSLASPAAIEGIRPNPSFLNQVTAPSSDSQTHPIFEFNMTSLVAQLRKLYESNPSSPHYNLNVLVYKIANPSSVASIPIRLHSYWRTEASHTDVRIDYELSPAPPCPLNGPFLNLCFTIPLDGGVTGHQSQPESIWDTERQELKWRLTELSRHGESQGSLKARLNVSGGPSSLRPISVTWTTNEASLSGTVFVLACDGWKISLMRRKVVAGKYFVEPQLKK